MTKNDLKMLRKSMPPKYRNTLSVKFNVCEKYIDCIFRGERTRIDIIDEAIRMAKEYQYHIKAQTEIIRKL
jgi:hypothetical protein